MAAKILPLPSQAAEAIADIIPIARKRTRTKDRDAPTAVLSAVERVLGKARTKNRPLGQDACAELGALVGQQYVSHLGWSWVEVAEDDQDSGLYAVIHPNRDLVIYPLHWMHEIDSDPDREIAIALNFNMVVAGNVPAGTPGDPISFH